MVGVRRPAGGLTSATWPTSDDYAGIDIARLDPDGKVVEHWDALQVLPETSANDNGMF